MEKQEEKIPLKQRKKEEGGITLIALVITIIVLLILAGVTIATLTGDNGILTKAGDAKTSTEIAEVKERVQTDILGEQAGNNGELTKGKFIEILNKYFKDVPTEENFPEDITSLILKTKEEYGSHDIKISEIYSGSFPKTPETVGSLKVGDKVYYDTGNSNIGEEGIIECTVLYDKAYNEEKGTNYGIQIISTDIIKNSEGTKVAVNLGSNDETVDGSGFNKARNSYNNALKRLYDEAQKYLNTTYASEARCVGSDPADPDWDTETDEAEYFTRNEGDEDYYSYMKNYYGTFKDSDDKYDKDWTQMGTIEGIKPVSDYYWLASRNVNSDSYHGNFYVRSVNTSGALNGRGLCLVRSRGRALGFSYADGFRPVFTLKSDIKITEGDGVDTPYRLES